MNFGQIIAAFLPSIFALFQAMPGIVKAWETSGPNNGLQNVAAAIPPALLQQLAEAGGILFPKLSPELQAAAAALVVAHPNSVSWAQSSLNLMQSSGYVNFDGGKGMGSPLVVDGIFGKRTFAALEALQTKAGLPVTGALGDLEYNTITALLQKL